jgi:hypothetical protein
MDLNEAYEPPSAELAPEPALEPSDKLKADVPQGAIGGSVRRGAIRGFQWVSFVAAPISVIMLALGLALTALNAGTGRKWGLQQLVIGTVLIFPVCPIVYGSIPGAVIGLVVGILRRGRPPSAKKTWWTRLNQPIRWPTFVRR